MDPRRLCLWFLSAAVLWAIPATTRADPVRDLPVVVHRVECSRWRCGAGFRDALTDRVTSALTKGHRYKPVDRGNLQKALGEQLQCRKGIRKGIISRECLIQAGRVMAARKMITGRLVKIGKRNFQLTLGVTDLSTVKNERSVSEDCWGCNKRALLKLVDRAVAKLVGKPVQPQGGGGSQAAGPGPAPSGPRVSGGDVTKALGRLIVRVRPSTARVRVTGPKKFSATGRANWERADLKPGTYQVVAGAKGYATTTRSVTVGADDIKTLTITLELPGNLKVTGKPAGARVEITGPGGFSVVKGLPVTVSGATRGAYQVKVSRTGYRAVSQQAVVRPGKTTTVTVTLKKDAPVSSGPVTGKAGITWIRSRPAGVSFGKTEVTLGQYRACVRAGVCKKKTYRTKTDNKYCNWGHTGREQHPMNCVDWHGATAFCRWAGGRLPRSKEWFAEASKGGTRTYPWGSEKATCARAIMNDGGLGCGKKRTWPVCSKPRGNSVSGLCDMSGNVWEWTSTAKGSARVVRGGGWLADTQALLRSSARSDGPPSFRLRNDGFRCARSPH